MSKLQVITYISGKLTYLDGRIESVTINGDVATCFRTCEVSLINAVTLRNRSLAFELGAELRVLYDKKEIFRGIIFTQGIDTSGSQSLKAYDYNVYLTKNTTTVAYKNKTATQIVKDLCAKFGIQTGTLADTGYVIKSHVARGKALDEIITMAFTVTEKAKNRKYRIKNIEGKLTLVLVRDEVKSFIIENGRNLTSANYSESIEDVRTTVKLTGGDEKKPITAAATSALGSKYGRMQHQEHFSDVKKKGELATLAKSILADLSSPKREFSVEALGDTEITSGVNIAVKDTMTGIAGAFWVSTDSHKFSADGTYTMSLQLSRTFDAPQIEPEVEKKE